VISCDSPAATDRSRGAFLVSVIIVTHNSADVIATALNAVCANLPHAEIIVVDNASTDATCDLVAEFPSARLIAGQSNLGFGTGVNRGAEAAAGRLLLVMNPDAFPTSADAGALSALAGRSPLGLLGCQVREAGHNQRSVHVRWGWRRELCWTLVAWYLLPRGLNLIRPGPRRGSSIWIAGAAFIVDREEFLHVGGFDERFFLYYEDFDLSRAYAAHGLPLAATDAVTLEHIGRASSPHNDDLIVSLVLMSLIEQTGKWEGIGMARAAARWASCLLGVIAVAGRLVRGVPWIGHRGVRKASSASRVRRYLRHPTYEGSTAPYYPIARAALLSEVGDGAQYPLASD
jgi:N-acetylglucosaminyl-diphospho-decaprenol L-rhamnosyltransferase